MHKEYILLNGFRTAKKGFTAGFHVPLISTNILKFIISSTDSLNELVNSNDNHVHAIIVELCEPPGLS